MILKLIVNKKTNHHLKNKRILGIDLLRIFSLFLVLNDHLDLNLPLFFGGTHGVIIFFMISGFCMVQSIKGRDLKGFLISRFWRLLPLFIICSIITMLAIKIFPEANSARAHRWDDWFYTLFSIPTASLLPDIIFTYKKILPHWGYVDGSYWSLLVEFRFYFLFAICIYTAKLKITQTILLLSILSLLSLLNQKVTWVTNSNDFFHYLPFFSIGLVLGEFLKTRVKLTLLFLVLNIICFAVISNYGVKGTSIPFNEKEFIVFALCILVFIITVILKKPSGRFISKLGLITYPVYLIHQEVSFILMDKLKLTLLSDFFIKIIVLLLIFIMAYKCQNLNDWLIPQLKKFNFFDFFKFKISKGK